MTDSDKENSNGDEPKIIVDSDWKEQVAKEREALAADDAESRDVSPKDDDVSPKDDFGTKATCHRSRRDSASATGNLRDFDFDDVHTGDVNVGSDS